MASRTPWWRRAQTLVTVGLFAAASVLGVNVGLQGAAISPVAPAPAVVAAPVVPGQTMTLVPADDTGVVDTAPNAHGDRIGGTATATNRGGGRGDDGHGNGNGGSGGSR